MKTKAGTKEWIGLAVLVLPCLIVSMDVSVLLFAMPFISVELKPSGTNCCGSWTCTASYWPAC